MTTYKVLTRPGDAAHRVAGLRRTLAANRRALLVLGALALVAVGVGATLGWQARQQAEPDAVAKLASEAALPLPDRPSIAVLPFDNLSGDPEQEYFSDGLTENLLTQLSKNPELFVIARNSRFKFKGKAVDVRQVGRELGVRYVLEGSVQGSKNRVRINTQLIDAATGSHIWAERYDRDMQDIFLLQDEIIVKISMEIAANLTGGEGIRGFLRPPKNLEAYDNFLKGLRYFVSPISLAKVRTYGQKTIQLDPDWSRGYDLLCFSHALPAFLKLPRK